MQTHDWGVKINGLIGNDNHLRVVQNYCLCFTSYFGSTTIKKKKMFITDFSADQAFNRLLIM